MERKIPTSGNSDPSSRRKGRQAFNRDDNFQELSKLELDDAGLDRRGGIPFLNMVHREVLDLDHELLLDHMEPWSVSRELRCVGCLQNFHLSQLSALAIYGNRAVNRLLLLMLWRQGSYGYLSLVSALHRVGQGALAFCLLETEQKVQSLFPKFGPNRPQTKVKLPVLQEDASAMKKSPSATSVEYLATEPKIVVKIAGAKTSDSVLAPSFRVPVFNREVQTLPMPPSTQPKPTVSSSGVQTEPMPALTQSEPLKPIVSSSEVQTEPMPSSIQPEPLKPIVSSSEVQTEPMPAPTQPVVSSTEVQTEPITIPIQLPFTPEPAGEVQERSPAMPDWIPTPVVLNNLQYDEHLSELEKRLAWLEGAGFHQSATTSKMPKRPKKGRPKKKKLPPIAESGWN